MKKIALIDFCGTVVDFQTLDPYLKMVLHMQPGLQYKLKYYLFCNSFARFGCRIISKVLRDLIGVTFSYKHLLVRLLKDVKKDEFVRIGKIFYEEKIKTHIIPETIDIINSLKDSGCLLLIVSGGSSFYISFFAGEYGIDCCFTVEIGFNNGVCTGKIIRECLRKEKVELVQRFVSDNNLSCSFEAGITDSVSDLPMLDMCRDKYVVSNNAHQDWVTDDMKEIIYIGGIDDAI